MSPLDAIGYAVAAFIAMPVAAVVIALAGAILALLGSLAFVVMDATVEWSQRKWGKWRVRK